jgi:hypothetical protein
MPWYRSFRCGLSERCTYAGDYGGSRMIIFVGKEVAQPLEADAARANMQRLLDLLPSTADILERVELYRQLGRFRDALELIPSAPPEQWVNAHFQKQWAEAEDSTMRVIPTQVVSHARKSQRGAVVW